MAPCGLDIFLPEQCSTTFKVRGLKITIFNGSISKYLSERS